MYSSEYHLNSGIIQSISLSQQIIKEIKNYGADICHCHGYRDSILLHFSNFFSKNFVIISTLHGFTSTSLISKLGLYYLTLLLVLRWNSATILVNKQMSQHPWICNARLPNIRIVENGIPLQSDDSVFESKQDLTSISDAITAFKGDAKMLVYVVIQHH